MPFCCFVITFSIRHYSDTCIMCKHFAYLPVCSMQQLIIQILNTTCPIVLFTLIFTYSHAAVTMNRNRKSCAYERRPHMWSTRLQKWWYETWFIWLLGILRQVHTRALVYTLYTILSNILLQCALLFALVDEMSVDREGTSTNAMNNS